MIAPIPRRWLTPALLTAAMLGVLPARGASGEGGAHPRPQIVEDLYDAHFLDPAQGWVVGAFGSIYHTADGGRHWRAQKTPSTQHLYGVSFADAERGWAVGRSGEVLYTHDGGEHWVEQKSGTGKHLFKVCFLDAREGWAVGDWGVVIHTRDGGVTWEDRSVSEDRVLYAVDFADHENGWMVGESGSIRHTGDGGETWREQDSGTRKTFFGVAAVSRERAWVVGIDGLVERTRDGGATWELQRGARQTADFEKVRVSELLRSPSLYDVKIRGGKGYIVGDVGNVLVSEDGGETWARSLLPPRWRFSWLRGLSVLPSGSGMLVGAQGLTFAVEGRSLRFSQAPD